MTLHDAIAFVFRFRDTAARAHIASSAAPASEEEDDDADAEHPLFAGGVAEGAALGVGAIAGDVDVVDTGTAASVVAAEGAPEGAAEALADADAVAVEGGFVVPVAVAEGSGSQCPPP